MNPQIRSAVLQGFRELTTSIGLDPVALMHDHGLDPTCFNDPDRRVSAEAVFRLFENTANIANIPDLGLRLAAARPFSIMGPLFFAARDEPSVREAFYVISKHLYLHNEGIHIRVSEQEDIASIEISSNLGKALPIPVSIESAACMAIKILKAFLGESWMPASVFLKQTQPTNLSPYLQAFGCDLKFGKECTAIHVRTSDLDRSNPMSSSGLAPYARKYLKELVERPGDSLMDRVRQLIHLELASGRCTALRTAQSLGINRRTLHRQLADSHTTYTEIFESVREELAQRYVCNSQHQLSEVSEMLGFSEVSAFSRWYKKQFNESPSAARKLVQQAMPQSFQIDNAAPHGGATSLRH
jgi:AraC-like DNA-binding protein